MKHCAKEQKQQERGQCFPSAQYTTIQSFVTERITLVNPIIFSSKHRSRCVCFFMKQSLLYVLSQELVNEVQKKQFSCKIFPTSGVFRCVLAACDVCSPFYVLYRGCNRYSYPQSWEKLSWQLLNIYSDNKAIWNSIYQWFSILVLGHCTFCMSFISDTLGSVHEFLS